MPKTDEGNTDAESYETVAVECVERWQRIRIRLDPSAWAIRSTLQADERLVGRDRLMIIR